MATTLTKLAEFDSKLSGDRELQPRDMAFLRFLGLLLFKSVSEQERSEETENRTNRHPTGFFSEFAVP
jgi:hypothetical protein